MITRLYPFFLLLCFGILACNGEQPQVLAASMDLPSFSDLPSRRDLSRQMRQQGEVIIAYSAGSEELREIASRFQDGRGRIRFRAVSDKDVSRKMLQEKVVFALGAPTTNWISKELNSRMPFRIMAKTLQFEGKAYGDATLLLSMPLYPSPFNQNIPVIWASGLSDEMIARQLKAKLDEGWSPFGWNAGGYEIYEEGERILLGYFDERSWQPDKSLQFDFSKARDTLLQSTHFRVLANQSRMSESDLKAFIEACEAAAETIREFTGETKNLSSISLHLYPSAEEKGLRLFNTDHSHINFEGRSVHTVYNNVYGKNMIGKENELLLRQLLGQPQTMVLERGLAVRFTEQWQMKGYKYWARQLFYSGNMVALSELLDNERFQSGSELIMEPLAASFVDFLLEEFGRAVFLENYVNWKPHPGEITKLEKQWHQTLEGQMKDFVQVKWTSEELPYLRGFNFAHEGYAIYNGYISRKAAESLTRMASLGSSAASIIPYSYIRNPQVPAPIPVADRPGSENDESVINAIYSTKKLGMVTILKPQIWLGGGSWPGDVEMQNEEDWQAFFNYYYDWIRHYAMIAEIHQVDMLVIGTEFAKATLAREDDWVTLIRKIRKLYCGKITYASNWGDEFENVGFWEELDYIGLDCYYPLSKNERASEEELDASFKDILKKIETIQKKYDKPLFFSEIGFRSIPTPWKQPHAEANGAGYDGEHQKLCYEIVMKNLEDKEWCQGLMFWKWPSYLESRGPNNTDFSPNGKPAEKAVAKWFGRLGR